METTRVVGALAVVIGLIFLLRWGGKKLFQSPGNMGSTRAVQVLARSPLSPRQQILLLRIGRRVIVVGDSGSQMNPLSEISDPDEVASLIGQLRDEKTESASRAFGNLFHRAASTMRGEAEADDVGPGADRDTEDSPDAEAAEAPVDPMIADTHDEITGLAAKIRGLAQQFRG